MNMIVRASVGIVVAVFVAAAAASAQAPPPGPGAASEPRRPHDSLFDSGSNDSAARPSLVLEISAYGGHDDDVIAQESTGNPQFGVPGEFVGGRAALDYTRAGQHTTFALGGNSTL